MSITDELRKWAEAAKVEDIVLTTYPAKHAVHGIYEQLLAIADRIDAEHQRAIASVMNDALYHANDESMAELGWVHLPKDADGEYWFCGDKITLPDGNVVEIIGIGGDWLYYRVESVAIAAFGRIRAHDKHHYHAPTVEDVLREFARECLTYATCVDDHEVQDAIEMYAAKLSLADDGKEQQ